MISMSSMCLYTLQTAQQTSFSVLWLFVHSWAKASVSVWALSRAVTWCSTGRSCWSGVIETVWSFLQLWPVTVLGTGCICISCQCLRDVIGPPATKMKFVHPSTLNHLHHGLQESKCDRGWLSSHVHAGGYSLFGPVHGEQWLSRRLSRGGHVSLQMVDDTGWNTNVYPPHTVYGHD